MLICTYMDMDVMIHQKTNSLKKLNKSTNLIKTYVSISNLFLKISEVTGWGVKAWYFIQKELTKKYQV